MSTTLVPQNRQLILPGFKCSPVGLAANKTLTQEQCDGAGRQLSHVDARLSWYIGDFANIREDRGYGSHVETADRFNIAHQTVKNTACVCRAFEQYRRRDRLTFGHHAEVTNRNDADELLDWCVANNASVQELRAEKRHRQREAARIPPPEGKYRVLYADSPWQYNDERRGLNGYSAAVDHFPTMSLQEICELPIEDIAHDNSVLFLWTTSPLIGDAFQVVEAWGFEYKANCVWNKATHNVGHYFSVHHEHLLLCTRGSCTPDTPKQHNSVQCIERAEHSRKPAEFYSLIESMYTTGPYIELFARQPRWGWEAWGNEAGVYSRWSDRRGSSIHDVEYNG